MKFPYHNLDSEISAIFIKYYLISFDFIIEKLCEESSGKFYVKMQVKTCPFSIGDRVAIQN